MERQINAALKIVEKMKTFECVLWWTINSCRGVHLLRFRKSLAIILATSTRKHLLNTPLRLNAIVKHSKGQTSLYKSNSFKVVLTKKKLKRRNRNNCLQTKEAWRLCNFRNQIYASNKCDTASERFESDI